MKKIILYLMILIFGVNIVFGSLEDGLVAYWSLDNLNDLSGNGNTLTNNGASLVEGIIENGYKSTSSNEYLTYPVLSQLSQGSIGFWFKLDETFNSSDTIYPVQFINANIVGSNVGDFQIQLKHNLGSLYFRSEVAGINLISTQNSWVNDTWYYIIVTWDGLNKYCYIDGAFENNVSDSSPYFSTKETQRWIIMDSPSKGLTVDEFSIWNRTLSETEIETLYNNGLGLQYPFNTNGNLTIPQANLIIDEVFNDEFTNPRILNNQVIYTSFISGITEERTYNRYIIAGDKRYAIYYGKNPSIDINQDNTFYSLELGFQTETELRDALDDLIN